MSPIEHNNWPESLVRRSYGIPVLELLVSQARKVTFGNIMHELQISKRGLALTLKDLEDDGLIIKKKVGRSTRVMITSKGENALLDIKSRDDRNELVERTVNETVALMEKECIIKDDWDEEKRQEFINKLKKTITEQLSLGAIEGQRDD